MAQIVDEILTRISDFESVLPPLVLPKDHPGGRSIAGYIDHTLLKPEATPDQVEKLCREALEHQFAAVCVNPVYVPLCHQMLSGSKVLVCTVVGFPLGATFTQTKVDESLRAIEAGAQEIDMVIPVGLLRASHYNSVAEDIACVVDASHAHHAIVKVILEMALLNRKEKIAGCLLSQAAGADFVKTSTGFGPGGATLEDVEMMRRVVGPTMGVKAAGGIRSLADARAMLMAGATRLGTSSGVKMIREAG